MQRDMNLVRKILLALETSAHGHAPLGMEIEGYSEEQIGYHVHLLGQAKLLTVEVTTGWGSQSPKAIPTSITWEGHEFLDSARDETIWSKAMKKAGDVGGPLSLTVLKSVLDSLLKGQLGL